MSRPDGQLAASARRRPTPAPRIAGWQAYHVPRPAARIDLWLDSNEGCRPPAGLLDVLVRGGTELLRRYPRGGEAHELVARRFGLSVERVLITAGIDDALLRACLALLAPGRDFILPMPTFEMLERYARLAGGTVVEVPWPEGPYPSDMVLERIGPATAMIAVVSPNNPTGAVATAADLRRLSQAAPHALLLVDLAYAEFADEDLMPVGLALPNALVLRTLSKAWGLAGARVGFALGPAEVIGWLRNAGNPYAVTGPSLALAAECGRQGDGYLAGHVARVRYERQVLFELLLGLGGRPQPSQGNFVLVRLADAVGVHDRLAQDGIAVRVFPDRIELRDCLRITCPGDECDFDRLCAALRRAMPGGGTGTGRV